MSPLENWKNVTGKVEKSFNAGLAIFQEAIPATNTALAQ